RRGRALGRAQAARRDRRDRPARQAVADSGRRGRRGRLRRRRRVFRRRRVTTRQKSQAWLPAAEQKPGSTRTLLPVAAGMGAVRRTVLPGGLRILTEEMPSARSASFGIWVGVGSRDETRSLAGATHFLEHLLFKGTPRRDALAISAALDAVGGEMNA